MKPFVLIFLLLNLSLLLPAQIQPSISNIEWGKDLKLHITFSNDSSTIHNIQALYHATNNASNTNEMVYYPAKLDPEFINALKNKNISKFAPENQISNSQNKKARTLWSAIHDDLGGGYIHFINSLVYTYETGQLSNTAPLMKRIRTEWKPKPLTETYKRTKKWVYYVPTTQKDAIKEYKAKVKNNSLGDIILLPPSFIELFLQTNQHDYQQMVKNKEVHKLAIIDMVHLLIGSNYLAQEQIDFVRNAVTTAITKYNSNKLPPIIIFDDFDAAVAMTLDINGYNIDKVIFNSDLALSPTEMEDRLATIEKTIQQINAVNKKVFETNLKKYYQ